MRGEFFSSHYRFKCIEGEKLQTQFLLYLRQLANFSAEIYGFLSASETVF